MHSVYVHATSPYFLLLAAMAATASATTIAINVTHLCGKLTTTLPPASIVSVAETSKQPTGRFPLNNANGSSSLTAVTEFLFGVSKPQWTGFAYASRTAVRKPSVVSGPTALMQRMRLPGAKYEENVKLDHHVTRADFGADAVGPFGIGLAVGDVGLRFIGNAEATVMWHSLPTELVLDLVDNAYDWDVIVKKVFFIPSNIIYFKFILHCT